MESSLTVFLQTIYAPKMTLLLLFETVYFVIYDFLIST